MSAQLDKLKARLAAISPAVKAAVVPALLKSGDDLADKMKTLAPKRTDALEDSIQVTPPGSKTPVGDKTAGELQVYVTAGDQETIHESNYAPYVEYGTKNTPAEPFFWPAYRLSKKQIQTNIKRAVNKAVKDAWSG